MKTVKDKLNEVKHLTKNVPKEGLKRGLDIIDEMLNAPENSYYDPSQSRFVSTLANYPNTADPAQEEWPIRNCCCKHVSMVIDKNNLTAVFYGKSLTLEQSTHYDSKNMGYMMRFSCRDCNIFLGEIPSNYSISYI